MNLRQIGTQVDCALKEISSLDLNRESVYDEILKIIEEQISLVPCPKLICNPGKTFYRSRCHRDGEFEFNELSQLSYRKDTSGITDFGRANRPKQSIFYCGDSWDTAVFEAGKISRIDDHSSILEEIHSVSKWISKKELIFLVFLDSNRAIEKSVLAERHVKNLDKQKDGYEIEMSFIATKIIRFISEEFTKESQGNSNSYKISCAFAEQWMKVGVDGIIYPSYQRCFEQLNYAIKPEVVDEKLDFVDASIEYLERQNGSNYIKKFSRFLKCNDNGCLTWGEKFLFFSPSI